MKLHLRLSFAILVFAQSGAWAQQSASPDDSLNSSQIYQLIGGACPGMVNSIMNRMQGQAALEARAVNTDQVCKCTEERYLFDSRLQNYLDTDKTKLKERLNSAHLKSYFIVRLAESVFSCLSADMELSLQATSPEK